MVNWIDIVFPPYSFGYATKHFISEAEKVFEK